ncbi:uncharacterized protein [Asterias amurensis]|uniref:uncharacterized protein isoform X2 n=1 Tax=Asterias amurensis TaxID=7602 RepID=UPI003AB5342F
MDTEDLRGHPIDENEVNRRTELITNAAEKYLNGEVSETDNATTVETVMAQQLLTTTPLEMGLQMHNITTDVSKKRDSHNEIERRRKCKINIGIIKLGDIIPICQTTKMSKNQILEQACLYIDELREQKEKLLLANTSDPEAAEEIKKLRKENEKLRAENKRNQEIIQDMESHPNGMVEQPKVTSRHSRKSDRGSSASATSKAAATAQTKPHITYLPGGPNQVTVAVQGMNQMQQPHVIGGGQTTLVGNLQGTPGGMAILQPNPNGSGYILVPAVNKYTSTSIPSQQISNQTSVVVSMSGNQATNQVVIGNQASQPVSLSQASIEGSVVTTQAQMTSGQQVGPQQQQSTQLNTSISDTTTAQSTMVTQAVNTPITTPGNQNTVLVQSGNVQAPGQVQSVRYIVPLVQGAGQSGTTQSGNQAIMLTLPVRQGQNVPIRIAPSSAAPSTRSSQPMILPQPASGGTSVNAQIMQGSESTTKSKKKSLSKVKSISETETEPSRTGSPSMSQTAGQQHVNMATPPPGGVVRLPVAGTGAETSNIIVNSQGQQIVMQKPQNQGMSQNVMPMQIVQQSRPMTTQNLVYIQQNGQLIPVILQQQSNQAAAGSGTQPIMQPIQQQQQQPQQTGVNQNYVTLPINQSGNRVLQTSNGGQYIMSGQGFQNTMPVNTQQGAPANTGVSFTHQASPSTIVTGQGGGSSQQNILHVLKQEPQSVDDQKGFVTPGESNILAPLNVLTSGQESSDRNEDDIADYSNDRDNDILAKAAESIFSPNSMEESSPLLNFSDISGSGVDIKPNITQQSINSAGMVTLQSGLSIHQQNLGRELPTNFSTPLHNVVSTSDDTIDTSTHHHEKHKPKKKKKKKNKEKDKEKKKHHHHHHSHSSKTGTPNDDAVPMSKSGDVSLEGSPCERANMIAESLLQSWMEKPDATDKEVDIPGSTTLTSNYSTEALIAGNSTNLPIVSSANSIAVCGSTDSTPTNSSNAFTSFPSFNFGSDILSSSMSVSGLPTYIEEESDFQKNDSGVNSLKELTNLRDSITSLSGGQSVVPQQQGVDSVSNLNSEQPVAPANSIHPGAVIAQSEAPPVSSTQSFMLDSPTVSQASVATSDSSAAGFVSPIPSIFSINSSIPESGVQKSDSCTATPVANESDQDLISTQVVQQSAWISHHSKASELARGLQPARTQTQPPPSSVTTPIQMPVPSTSSDVSQQGGSGLFSPLWLSPSSSLGSKQAPTSQTPSQESPPLSFSREMSEGSFPSSDPMQNMGDTSSNIQQEQPQLMDLNKTAMPSQDGLRGMQHLPTSGSHGSQLERPSILDVTPTVTAMGNLDSPHSSADSCISWNPGNMNRSHRVDDHGGIGRGTPEFPNPLPAQTRPGGMGRSTPEFPNPSPAQGRTGAMGRATPDFPNPSPGQARTGAVGRATPEFQNPSPVQTRTGGMGRSTPDFPNSMPAQTRPGGMGRITPDFPSPSPVQTRTGAMGRSTPDFPNPSPVQARTGAMGRATPEFQNPSTVQTRSGVMGRSTPDYPNPSPVQTRTGVMGRGTHEFPNPLSVQTRTNSELQGPTETLLQVALEQPNTATQNNGGSVDNIGLQNLMSLAESTARPRTETISLTTPTPLTSPPGRSPESASNAGKKSQPGKTFSIKNLHRTLTSEITESPKRPKSPSPVEEPPQKPKSVEKTIPPLKIKIPKSKRKSSCQKEQPERPVNNSEVKLVKGAPPSDMDQIGKRELNPNLIDKYPWLAEGEEDGDGSPATAGEYNQSRDKHSFSVQNISQSSQRSGRKDSSLVMTIQRRENRQVVKEKPKASNPSSAAVTSSQSPAQVHSLWNPSNNEGYGRPNVSRTESSSLYSSHLNDAPAGMRTNTNVTSSSPVVQHNQQLQSQPVDVSQQFSMPMNREPNPVVPPVVEKVKTKKPTRRGSNSSSHSIRSSSEPDCSPMQPCISEHSSPSGFPDLQVHNLTSDSQPGQTTQTNSIRSQRQSPVINVPHQQPQSSSNVPDPKRYPFQQNQNPMFLHHEESRPGSNHVSNSYQNSFQNFMQTARGTDFLGQSTDPTDPIDFNLNMFDNQKQNLTDQNVVNASRDSRQEESRGINRQVHSQPSYISQSEMAQVSDPSQETQNKSVIYTQSDMSHSARFGTTQTQSMNVQQHGQAVKRVSNTPAQSNPAKRASIHHNHHNLPHMPPQDQQRQSNISMELHHATSVADTRTTTHSMHQAMVSSHATTMRRTNPNERTLTSAQSQRQTFESVQSAPRFQEGSTKGRKRGGQSSEQFFHGLSQGQSIDSSLRHIDVSGQEQSNWPGFSTQRTPESSEPFLPLFSSSGMTPSQNAPSSSTNASIVSSLSPSTSRRLRGNELPTYLPHLPGPILPSPTQSNKSHQNRNESDIGPPFNAMFGPGRPGSIPMNVAPNFPVFTEHQTPHTFNVGKTAQISGGVNVPPPFNFSLFNDQHSQPGHCNDPPLIPAMHLHSNPALQMEDGMALRGNVGARHPQSFGNNVRIDSLLSQGAPPDGRPFKVGMPMGPHYHSTFPF